LDKDKLAADTRRHTQTHADTDTSQYDLFGRPVRTNYAVASRKSAEEVRDVSRSKIRR
jgi:hypothetical protein